MASVTEVFVVLEDWGHDGMHIDSVWLALVRAVERADAIDMTAGPDVVVVRRYVPDFVPDPVLDDEPVYRRERRSEAT